MEIITDDSSLSRIQKFVKLEAEVAVHDGLLDPFAEPDDSGIDSDDPSPPALDPSTNCSSDEEYPDILCPIHDMNTLAPLAITRQDMTQEQRDSLDIFIQWMPDHSPNGAESLDRSSPPLYEVELTASDEDDDASVLELVIPMQSRYQRVPTSSPKKTKVKPSIWAKLFCCIRK